MILSFLCSWLISIYLSPSLCWLHLLINKRCADLVLLRFYFDPYMKTYAIIASFSSICILDSCFRHDFLLFPHVYMICGSLHVVVTLYLLCSCDCEEGYQITIICNPSCASCLYFSCAYLILFTLCLSMTTSALLLIHMNAYLHVFAWNMLLHWPRHRVYMCGNVLFPIHTCVVCLRYNIHMSCPYESEFHLEGPTLLIFWCILLTHYYLFRINIHNLVGPCMYVWISLMNALFSPSIATVMYMTSVQPYIHARIDSPDGQP